MSIRNRLAAWFVLFAIVPALADGPVNPGPSTGIPSGGAGGGLTGTYPNPTVATIPNSALPTGVSGVLGSLRSANMNVTTDQAISIASRITAFQITSIVVTNCSATPTAAIGGFYPTTAKGGTPIVAASQAYGALSAATIILSPAIASNPRMTLVNVYFSLTTGAGVASTCDLYVIGSDLT